MALLTRMIRLFKADLHGVMDQIENQDLLLKQHLRDMQESLVQKEAKLKHMRQARNQARQDYDQAEKERVRLEQDLTAALKKDKDDISRMLIKKLKPLTGLQTDRRNHIDRLSGEIEAYRENIEQQRLQYEQLHQKATEYFHRSQQPCWEDMWPSARTGMAARDLSEEEIELELLQRKEALKGGATS